MRAATRGSPLARWQTAHVVALLAAAEAGDLEPVVVSTEGDRRLDVPLSELGGKGVFAKEVQAAVLDGRAELAVHSAKDLPARTPEGLVIAAVIERADPRDALVGSTLAGLAQGAVVATGSRRRRVQLLARRPDLDIVDLRGNIATRLSRVGEVDAVVMAAAALDRMDLADRIAERLEVELMTPQVGQGVIAVECREDDAATREALAHLDHLPTRRILDVERGFLVELGGDCDLPAGAFARVVDDVLVVDAVLEVDGVLRRARTEAPVGTDPWRAGPALGAGLARELRDRP